MPDEREKVCAECGGYPLAGVPGSGEPAYWCPDHPHAEITEQPTYAALKAEADRLRAASAAELERAADLIEQAEQRAKDARAERDEAREDLKRQLDAERRCAELKGETVRLRAALRELREAAWDVYHRTTGARQDPEIKALRAAGEKADAALADRSDLTGGSTNPNNPNHTPERLADRSEDG